YPGSGTTATSPLSSNAMARWAIPSLEPSSGCSSVNGSHRTPNRRCRYAAAASRNAGRPSWNAYRLIAGSRAARASASTAARGGVRTNPPTNQYAPQHSQAEAWASRFEMADQALAPGELPAPGVEGVVLGLGGGLEGVERRPRGPPVDRHEPPRDLDVAGQLRI